MSLRRFVQTSIVEQFVDKIVDLEAQKKTEPESVKFHANFGNGNPGNGTYLIIIELIIGSEQYSVTTSAATSLAIPGGSQVFPSC